MAKRRRSERGTSLVDVLVGTTILVIGVLGLSVASSKTQAAQRSLEVQSAVEATLEEQSTWVRQTAFDAVVDQHHGRRFSVVPDGGWQPVLHTDVEGAEDFAGVVQVSEVVNEDVESGELLQVVLSVDGSGPSGDVRANRVLLISRLGSGG